MSRIHDALKKAEQERSYRRVAIEELEAPAAGPIPVTPESDLSDSAATISMGSGPVALDMLERFLPATVWRPDTASMLFFDSDREPSGTEEFRSLRSRLYQLREKTSLQKVLVASSVPQEGKSFIAANLAQALALQPNCRTLLIDADLRNPSLHSLLGTPAGPGLTDFLLSEEEEFEIVQRGPMENLFFISAGRPVTGPTEIFTNGRLQLLLGRLEPLFDWIIIDSTAAIPVTDAGLIANVCNGVLVVVRSNSTPFDVVRKALRRLPNELIIGVVLNGIPPEADLKLQRYYAAS